MATSLHQAVQTALVTWLASTPAGMAGFEFGDRWPDAGPPLPPRMITVLRAGAPEFTWVDEEEVEGTPTQVGTSNLYTYSFVVAQVELALQLDLWTTSDPERDDAVARLELALHASKSLTLAAYLAAQSNTSPQPFFETDLVVQCGAPWDMCLAGYLFDQPTIDDDPSSVKRREFRASYHGTAFYDFVYTTNLPRLDMVAVRQWMTTSGDLTPPSGAINHILTVTADGGTQADGT
jgi:hypothetical protein